MSSYLPSVDPLDDPPESPAFNRADVLRNLPDHVVVVDEHFIIRYINHDFSHDRMPSPVGRHVLDESGYMAGRDEDRLADLNRPARSFMIGARLVGTR